MPALEDPVAAALYAAMLEKCGPWCRLPSAADELREVVKGQFAELPVSVLDDALEKIEEAGLAVFYECRESGRGAVQLPLKDGRRQYARMARPEFKPPPNWDAPTDLIEYLVRIADGKMPEKHLGHECEKFGVPVEKVVAAGTPDGKGLRMMKPGPLDTWYRLHKKPKSAMKRMGWEDALAAWIRGEHGPQFGYEFPGSDAE